MNAKIKELEEANDALMLRVDELEERVETLENA
jgi:tetrahydromethanopterin S-methyltransferase subunit B